MAKNAKRKIVGWIFRAWVTRKDGTRDWSRAHGLKKHQKHSGIKTQVLKASAGNALSQTKAPKKVTPNNAARGQIRLAFKYRCCSLNA